LHRVHVVQIDGGNLAVAIDDLPAGGPARRPDGHRFADQAAAHEAALPPPADGAVHGDGADHLVRAIGHGWNPVGERSRVGPVAAGGHCVPERLVWALQVVPGAEGVEVVLGVVQVNEVAVSENLGDEGAVEAFDLALGLRW